MRLKSFHGPTVNDAMRQVRAALGPDAIIVATREEEGGVRITAALEGAPQATGTTTAGRAAQPQQPSDEDCGTDIVQQIAEALLRHQVSNALAERLLATATQCADEDAILSLAAAFDTHLTFKPLADEKGSKPLVFIGPPGAGKTLCTAKCATRATLEKKPVTVITTDMERAGGMEQLAAFTRLLNLKLMEIEDAPALREAVDLRQHNEAMLIDTPGRNPFSAEERKQLHPLVTSGGGDAVLVLPADMDASQAIDMAQEFRNLGATRLLATRLDMTRRLGNLLHLAFTTRLPLTSFSASAKVTEPPQAFNPVVLARMVLAQAPTASRQNLQDQTTTTSTKPPLVAGLRARS